MTEYNKEEAKQNKIKQIEATTAAAVLQRVMKECRINVEYYQTDKSTVFVIPIGDGGVEIGLVNSDVILWKDALQGHLSFIKQQADIQEVLKYCKEHCLSVLGREAKKYAVITKKLKIIPNYYFRHADTLKSVLIYSNVTTIKNGAFSGCQSLKSINIPAGVSNIDKNIFDECNSLEMIVVDPSNRVFDSRDNCNAIIKTATNTLIAGCKNTVIPDSVTAIGEKAFDGCKFLTSIIIPYSVTKIEKEAFSNCSSLISIVIPDSVTKIGNYVFCYCYSLQDIRYAGTKAQWDEITKDIGWWACSKIKTLHCSDRDVVIWWGK